MTESSTLEPLLSVLRDLMAWLESTQTKGAVIGGVAVSLLARPRFTRDVDAIVWLEEDRWSEFLAAGARFGFTPRREDALDFAAQTRVLLVRHESSAIDADVSFGALPFEREMIENARAVDVGGVRLSLPTPESLVVMKAVASRSRDIADIESLLDAHPGIDRKKVRSWVRKFSSALEAPEIYERLDALLKRRRRPGRSRNR